MNLISGEKLQNLAEITIVFSDTIGDIEKRQLPKLNNFILLERGETIPDIIKEAESIFIYTHDLEIFFDRIYKHLTKNITLLSHNSDHLVDSKFIKYLEEDRITKWYCQNKVVNHPKLFSLPIGIANSMWPHGNQESIIKIRKNIKKNILVYKNFNIDTNTHERLLCNSITDKNGIHMSATYSNEVYWQNLNNSLFAISPPGNGIDCHRIWESIALRCSPVVLKNKAFDQFNHLPILFVDSWDQVTPEYLQSKVDLVKTFNFDIPELTVEYWRKII